ncbi:ParB/RepB/Spo0J family partition protein [Roseitranquillus sediminis]|uniref:ParB/RepB/Spo0J family partition protein n=1 Tax=Roseitranquillus sediminis TaxID=2809051 RepID=UPI001D0CA7D2|nr:ParB/RepB/Spo0J family partition protein [Roseitranquillus sediminis]MBM9596222.1 ParB/RepB/Spo0J family partition protein [Roseitranquillus sediminis]
MTEQPKQRGLGRGLSALMADVALAPESDATDARDVRRVPVEQIEPNPRQPRRHFAEEALADLAASIRQKGVVQPLILRPHPERRGSFQIVAGERRWRAAQLARQHDVPAIIRDLDDTEVLEVAIIENVQRADLNPVEEAAGYRQLMDSFGHTQERLAEALGKSRSHIANLLRLLQLPEGVQVLLRDGELSAGHARALITSPDADALARVVVAKGLSVRETERLAKGAMERKSAPQAKATDKDADTKALEADLSAALRLKVTIEHDGHDGGRLTLRYRTLEQLDELCRRLGGD